MKKLISLVLALTMVAALVAGCGSTAGNGGSGDKTVKGTMEEIINKVYEKQPLEMMLETATVDPSNGDQVWLFQSNTGLANGDDLSDVAISAPMIGSIPYGMAVVRVKDAANAKAVAEKMKNGINLGRWVCVHADDALVVGYGDVVMLVSTSSEAEVSAQQLVDAFKEVCGGDLDFSMEIPFEPQGGIVLG